MAINRVLLIGKEEMKLDGSEILHLPGLGIGIKCGSDSVMILNHPELSAINWIEPNDARALVICGKSFYAAEGDSIYRVATDSLPKKFIGRLDNEEFMLYPATDSTFLACTADEDFSCVYEINPEECTCMPFMSVEAALLKVSTNNNRTMFWIDDQVVYPMGNTLVTVFASPTITDIQLTPLGLMVATAEGLTWLTGPGKGTVLVDEPVSNVWWDDADVLYYLTAAGDLCAVIGLQKAYMEMESE